MRFTTASVPAELERATSNGSTVYCDRGVNGNDTLGDHVSDQLRIRGISWRQTMDLAV